MRAIAKSCLAGAILCFLTTGCSLEILTSAAVQSELQAQSAQGAMKQLEQAEKMADGIEIRHALQAFHAEYGMYPESLHDLVPVYLAEVPVGPDGRDRYAYDPETGWYGLPHERPTKPLTPLDRSNLEMINMALTNYYNANRQFPRYLSALAPNYLVSIPRTEAGDAFHYIPLSGVVMAPLQPREYSQQPAQQRQGAQGAVRPDIQNQYNDQIDQVINDLGI